jgi:hypothetical protein
MDHRLPLRPDSEDLKILKARAAELGLEPAELLSNLIRRNLRAWRIYRKARVVPAGGGGMLARIWSVTRESARRSHQGFAGANAARGWSQSATFLFNYGRRNVGPIGEKNR